MHHAHRLHPGPALDRQAASPHSTHHIHHHWKQQRPLPLPHVRRPPPHKRYHSPHVHPPSLRDRSILIRQDPLNMGGFPLPDITPTSLEPFADFHSGEFTVEGVKTKLHNLASQQTFMAFASVRSPENCIKIVRSLARYVAPLGEESTDRNHNHYFAFKGGRTKRCNPPTIHFRISSLAAVK